MITRKLEVIDGKAYMITTQELTKEQLIKLKEQQLKIKTDIEASIIDIDSKISTVADTVKEIGDK